MIEQSKPNVPLAEVEAWLTQKLGDVTGLSLIPGGFWSTAYSFCSGGRDLVLRLSDLGEGFAFDQAAMQFRSDVLPIPDVLETGQALGHEFAISQRHFGSFLEKAPVESANAVGDAIADLLCAMRAVPKGESVTWLEPSDLTWHDWVMSGLKDNTDSPTGRWREKLSKHHDVEEVFHRCEARIQELLSLCPERRDLVHSDLLHQNVLLSEDYRQVTGIFSWKCSLRGDFLYDVAWCTLWSRWFPVIAAADVWRRTLQADDLTSADLADVSERHHCYELQIAASHLGWHLWTENAPELKRVAAAANEILNRGPLADSP